MCTLRNYLRSPICSCYPLPSAMLPMHIHLTFPLLTTHVHSFPLCFSKFSPFLSISRADGNRWNQPKIVLVRCVLSHMFCVHRPVGLGLMKEYFENNGEKREMLLNRIIFFLFSKLFSLVIVIFCIFTLILRLLMMIIALFIVLARINSFPHNHGFSWPCIRSLLKTLSEKEKMLVTSIFSFPNNVFLPSHKK